MKKALLILLTLIAVIALLTLIADAFSKLSSSLLQFLYFVSALLIIIAGIYLILKLIKK